MSSLFPTSLQAKHSVMREGTTIKLGRLWFLLCEAPVLVLMVFVFLFGNRAVYADSQFLGVVYIASLVLLMLTSAGILLFGRQMRWVGVVGLATVVLAVFAGPPALAE